MRCRGIEYRVCKHKRQARLTVSVRHVDVPSSLPSPDAFVAVIYEMGGTADIEMEMLSLFIVPELMVATAARS